VVYCIGSPKGLQKYCKGSVDTHANQALSLSAFSNSNKRLSVNNGFCERSFILPLLHLCLIGIFYFWPVRMIYDLLFCQSASLGIQQISKHTFCKLNK
jgi:hypothetical protein